LHGNYGSGNAVCPGLPKMFARDCPTCLPGTAQRVCPRLAVPFDDGAYMGCGGAAVALMLRGAERAHTLAWQSWKRQCSLPGTRRNVCPGLPKMFARDSQMLAGHERMPNMCPSGAPLVMECAWGAVALMLPGAGRAHTLAWQSWKRQCSLPGTRRNVCPGLPNMSAWESECLPGTRELLASRHWARSRRSRSRCPARDARIERHKQIMKPQRVFARESRECLPGSPNVCPGLPNMFARAHANCLTLAMGRGRAGRAPVARRGSRAQNGISKSWSRCSACLPGSLVEVCPARDHWFARPSRIGGSAWERLHAHAGASQAAKIAAHICAHTSSGCIRAE
jgi:hypothetical protein